MAKVINLDTIYSNLNFSAAYKEGGVEKRVFFDKLQFPDKNRGQLIGKKVLEIKLSGFVDKKTFDNNLNSYANFLQKKGFNPISVDTNKLELKIKGYTVRFLKFEPITGIKNIPTAISEKGSVFILNQSLKPGVSYNSVDELKNDKETIDELNKIFKKWGEVPSTWINSYFQEQKKLFEIIGKHGWDKIEYDENVTFMKFIKEILKNVYNKRYSTWNPTDIWIIKASKRREIEKSLTEITKVKNRGIYNEKLLRLNDKLSDLLVNNDLIGISLKKIKDNPKFVYVNIKKNHITSAIRDLLDDDYEIDSKNIKMDFKLKTSTNKYREDCRINLGKKGYIQIKSNAGASSSSSNLKFESVIGGGGRGGKIEVSLIAEKIKTFKNNYKKYPSDEYLYLENRQEYENMFNNIKSKVDTDILNSTSFSNEIINMFKSIDLTTRRIAQIKLMELTFLNDVLKITDQGEFWTDILYSSLKKNRKPNDIFAPHAKLF